MQLHIVRYQLPFTVFFLNAILNTFLAFPLDIIYIYTDGCLN